MNDVNLYSSPNVPIEEHPREYVERKGKGHPDSICDAVMEAASVALCRSYLEQFGRVLHYNLDKALLVAGQTQPRLGGGEVLEPIQIIAGDRATREYQGKQIPVDDVVESAVLGWFRHELRFVDPKWHVAFQSAIRGGSTELVSIYDRKVAVANDTSVAVGYAPLSETERLVLEAERYLNSEELKKCFPAAGEDVKVMAVRDGKRLMMTVAQAFVDQFIANSQVYFDQKRAIAQDLTLHLQSQLVHLDDISVDVNTLDDASRGTSGMYLTVLGTSAEGADSGEVGRGNAVNGVISLNRPTSNEAAAGKNAACHVGKIYNQLSHEMAQEIVLEQSEVREAYVWLCSKIGNPLDQPWSISVSVILQPNATLIDVQQPIHEIIQRRLDKLGELTDRLIRGQVQLC